MDIFIASFKSSMYPEDDYILGPFITEEKAEEAIRAAIELDSSSYPNHPRRYQQNRYYYSNEQHYLAV